MEIEQADEVAAQKLLYVNKFYGKSLASAKVVYARDPEDTVMIRNLYPNISKHHGLKDVAVIRRVFCYITKHIGCKSIENAN